MILRIELKSGNIMEIPVYISKMYKDKLTEMANNLFKLKVPELKTAKDYVDVMCSLFERISKKDIKRILYYGWK